MLKKHQDLKLLILKSILERNFLRIINNPKIKVVAFDIFDTLVARKTFEASDIHKLMTISSSINKYITEDDYFFYKREYVENYARDHASNKEDITLEEIYNELKYKKSLKKDLIKNELLVENNLLFSNTQIDNWINKAKKYKKRVIVISDMYLSSTQIKKVALSKLKNCHQIDQVYVSSDIGKLKHSGSLFDFVLKEEKIKSHELLHIGDNYHSDNQIPKRKNIHTLYVGRSKNTENIFRIEQSYLKNKIHDLQSIREIANNTSPYDLTSIKHTYFESGAYVLGPVLWGFSIWLLELAERNKIWQINCVMREGRIFKKCLEYICKTNIKYKKFSINIIYASRASLFFPFIDSDKIDDSHLIYNSISIEDYYQLFNIKIISSTIKKYKHINFYKCSEIILTKNITLHEKIINDLMQRKKEIKTNSKQQANFFKEYLKRKKYTSNSILVDFGGGGSIIHSFNQLLKEQKPRVNALFYKHKRSFVYNEKIFSFLPYNEHSKDHINTLLRLAPVIETLFNGNEISTIKYQRYKKNIKAVSNSNQIKKIKFIKHFDKGLMSFFKVASYYKRNRNYTKKERIAFAEIVSRFLKIPTLQESIAFGLLPFEKNINGLETTTYSNIKSQQVINKIGLEKYFFNLITKNEYFWASTIWPEIELCKFDDKLLPTLFCNKNYTENIHTSNTNKIKEQLLQSSISQLSVYGTGQFAIELLPILMELNISINYFIDSNAKLHNQLFHGKQIISPEDAILLGESVFLIASAAFHMAMKKNLIYISKKSLNSIKIISIDK